MGALTVGGVLASRPEAAAAATTGGPYVVVDAGGGGDYTTIESAVAAVPANTTIFVKRGTYTVTSPPLAPAPGVRILGEGYGSCIRLADGMNTTLFRISNDRVWLESMRIDGNGLNQTYASGNAVSFVDQCKGGGITNCHVFAAAGYNIVAFSGCESLVIANNHSYDAREEGIELHGASYCAVVGNVVKNAGANGIYIWNADGDCGFNTVTGNTVVGSGWSNIKVDDGAHDNTVTGNTARAAVSHGIQVAKNSHDNTITGNAVVANGGYGILVNLCGATAISGNTAHANGSDGIRLDRTSDCAVSGNVVRENGRSGIYSASSEGCVVSGNLVSANKQIGIEMSTTSGEVMHGMICSDNICRNNGQDTSQGRRHGILIYGPYLSTSISGNRCYDDQATKTQTYGIGVSDAAPDGLLLVGNVLDGNRNARISFASTRPRMETVPTKRLVATVGTSMTAVPHGLTYTPIAMTFMMRSPGSVWQAALPDSTNVYLSADAPGRSVEVTVG